MFNEKSEPGRLELRGKVFPENVCGYGLGVYYEVNFRKKSILVEYYKNGYLYYKHTIELDNYLVK